MNLLYRFSHNVYTMVDSLIEIAEGFIGLLTIGFYRPIWCFHFMNWWIDHIDLWLLKKTKGDF